MTTPYQNWARNQTFQAQGLHEPESIDEVQRIVASSQRVKAIGTRHSFGLIADTNGDLISLRRYHQTMQIDPEHMTATVGAGLPYGRFCADLHTLGYAVHNMASLPQITLGGACATATHGSGDQHGNLATAVRALTLVTASGDIVTLDREQQPDDFRAVVVGLGGFGVVTDMTLDIRRTFTVRQDIYENLPVSAISGHFDEIMARGYSVSLFTDWQGDLVNQLWVKQALDDSEQAPIEPEMFGARLSEVVRHPSPGKPVEHCTDQLGAAGPWHERLPHFRMDAIGEHGDELQTEYFVDRKHAVAALMAVAGIQDQLAPLIKTSEVRTVASDDLWMSPSYESDCVGIHFSWKPDYAAVNQLLPVIEDTLRPFQPRPHWGKLFSIPTNEVASRYPRYEDFRSTTRRFDPDGKFRNGFLETYVPD